VSNSSPEACGNVRMESGGWVRVLPPEKYLQLQMHAESPHVVLLLLLLLVCAKAACDVIS